MPRVKRRHRQSQQVAAQATAKRRHAPSIVPDPEYFFANRSHRWIDSYISGLDERQQEFVERAEASHRRRMGEDLV
jgi:hypothetical protein